MMSKSSGAMPRAYEATVPPASNPRAQPVPFTASTYQQTGHDQKQNDRGWLRCHDPLSKPEVGTVRLRYPKSVKTSPRVAERANRDTPRILPGLDDRLQVVRCSGSQGESGWKEKVGDAPSKTIRHGHRRGRAQHRSGDGIRQEVHVNRRT